MTESGMWTGCPCKISKQVVSLAVESGFIDHNMQACVSALLKCVGSVIILAKCKSA